MMNQYNPNIHHRRSIRLKGYDYSQAGLYFITICVKNRECLFGQITNAQMTLNDAGQMIKSEWLNLPKRFKNIQLHEYIVMPNHFHAILQIVGATLVVAQNDNGMVAQNDNGMVAQNETNAHCKGNPCGYPYGYPYGYPIKCTTTEKGQPKGIVPTGKTVGDMVGAFESITTVEYIRGVKNKNWKPFNGKLWQRNYYDHIIRNEKSYQTISEYIINNPLKWNDDKFNPDKKGIVCQK